MFSNYLSWYRIISFATPGMASCQSLQRKPSAMKRSVFPYCLNSVNRTGRCKTAGRSKVRRDGSLVKPDKNDKEFTQYLLHTQSLNVVKVQLFFPEEGRMAGFLLMYRSGKGSENPGFHGEIRKGCFCFSGMLPAFCA